MGSSKPERAKVHVEIRITQFDGYLSRELIEVDLVETCPADDIEVDMMIQRLVGDAMHRATNQTATVFEKPVEEAEEVTAHE